MSRSATPPKNSAQRSPSAQQSSHPVRMLNPRRCGSSNTGISPYYMKHFRPNPLAGIGAATVLRIIHVPSVRESIDFICLSHCSVVFPKHKHRVRVISELLRKRERDTIRVDKYRSRSRCIKGNSHYLTIRRGKRFSDRCRKSLDIVKRMLAITVFFRRTELSPTPTRIRLHR